MSDVLDRQDNSLKVVGTRPIRPDGVDKVIGRATFGADTVLPGMLWGKVKRSRSPCRPRPDGSAGCRQP